MSDSSSTLSTISTTTKAELEYIWHLVQAFHAGLLPCPDICAEGMRLGDFLVHQLNCVPQHLCQILEHNKCLRLQQVYRPSIHSNRRRIQAMMDTLVKMERKYLHEQKRFNVRQEPLQQLLVPEQTTTMSTPISTDASTSCVASSMAAMVERQEATPQDQRDDTAQIPPPPPVAMTLRESPFDALARSQPERQWQAPPLPPNCHDLLLRLQATPISSSSSVRWSNHDHQQKLCHSRLVNAIKVSGFPRISAAQLMQDASNDNKSHW